MKENKSDKWLDYLTANGFDTLEIYNQLVARFRADPKKIMNDLVNKSQLLLQLEPKVKQYLVHISPYHKIEKIIDELVSKFKLSQQHVNLFMDRHLWINYSQDLLFDYLEKQNIKLKVRLHRGHYEVMVFMTQGMRQNFKRYGDVVHVTFNFVPTKRNPLMRVHYLGIFSGVGFSGDMIIFGLAVVVGSTPSFRAEAVEEFLSLVYPYRPLAIVGQHSQPIKQTIRNYNQFHKTNIKFFQNWHHTLERAQKQFESQATRKQILLKIRKILLSFNPQVSEQSLKYIDNLMQYEENRRLLRQMLKDTMSYWSDQNPAFVGFEIQANHFTTISEIVSSEFGYSRKLGNFIYECLQFQRKINLSAHRDKKTPQLQRFVRKYENVEVVDQMVEVGSILSSEIYKKLFYNYYISQLKCKFERTLDPLSIIVLQFMPPKSDKKQQLEKLQDFMNRQSELAYHEYLVRFNLLSDCWECQCKMIYWGGIPCAHLIKVVLFYGGSLEYYINSRWIKKNIEVQSPKDKDKLKQMQKVQVTNVPSNS